MYSQIFQLHADYYSALANPKRLEIVHLLRDQAMPVNQMVEMLGLPQANLSQHLMVLREFHLVETRKEGTNIYYKLSHKNIVKSSDLIREMLIGQNRGNEKLTEELRLKMKDMVPLVHDPVCGMRLSPKTAGRALKYKGKTIYFCAEGCENKFVNKHKTKEWLKWLNGQKG
ncbi:metalloregulator ArsR/SmtB family transcription factor [Candidatus Collierbacteria bacterium]|nr:metalloregulator ArsR/SmtB family transcription factor [Candidatus Collierbacteria bacterium]